MKRLVCGCQRFCLGVAFVLVMAATGGLVGAIGGLILVLISHTVLGLSAGMVELMPGSVGAGTVIAMSLGVFLTARHFVTFAWPRLGPLRERLVAPLPAQPALIQSPSPESNQVSS
jgi:hypothetical protein